MSQPLTRPDFSTVRYVERRTPLTAILTAAIKRRKVLGDDRITPAFVEAVMRRAHPGALLSQLYRVQFEEAITDAIATCQAMTLDDCIALAIAQDTAETRNEPLPLVAEPVARPALNLNDLRAVRRTLAELIPDARMPTPDEERAFARRSSPRAPREKVSAIGDAPSVRADDAPRVVAGMPVMAEAARTFLDKQVAGCGIKRRDVLRVYVGYMWPVAQRRGETLPTDAANVDAYINAIWPTYAAALGVPE